MNNGKICVSVCSENAAELVSRIKEAEQFADVIEVRFDCVEPQNIPDIFTALDSTKPLLLTFRPKEQGGNADLDLHGRIGFWTSFGTDGLTDSKKVWFDNEADLVNILQQPAERTVIRSLHDFSGVPDELDMIFDELSAKEEVVKIACSISEITEGIPIWRLLEKASTQHKQFIPIAMGEAGKWTRILGLSRTEHL